MGFQQTWEGASNLHWSAVMRIKSDGDGDGDGRRRAAGRGPGQDHPCSTPEVVRELLCNNNWMADLFTAFCNTQYSDVENAVINCCIS